MSHSLTHDGLKRELAGRLRRWVKYAWDFESLGYRQMFDHRTDYTNAVATEVEHRGDLPSGKDKCRTDVELELPPETLPDVLAFEIKMSTADAKNWFTQRQDYTAAGLLPAIVMPKRIAYQLAPHQDQTLQDSYVVVDEREHEWYWQHMATPPEIDRQFTVADPLETYDECPECGCWTRTKDGAVIRCANCSWSHITTDD